jgi:hypothetical protein
MFLRARCSLLCAEGFSCSLDVLNKCQGIKKIAILDQKNLCFFSAANFYTYLATLNPDPEMDPHSHGNQCGSTTLPFIPYTVRP